MPKFRYYITDIFNGKIIGTDDKTVAADFTATEDAFVVDTEEGVWMRTDECTADVEEYKAPPLMTQAEKDEFGITGEEDC